MTAERWRQIESLFEQALDRSPAERTDFLDQACSGDAELRGELQSLLDCDAPDQRLVEIPLAPAAHEGGGRELEGRRVGAYKLIRLIGHGGMGSVYLGVRSDDQYRQQVAIKLLNRGMDTDFMLSRFRQERQILASLEHPYIARLLDGGATDDGLPYFVMEYVDGVPITQYCRERNLSVGERIRLFRMVCEAVQYAHQHLVVHRDIKPGNILATADGVPKLLDFGIAKVIDPETASGLTLTRGEFRMLTPEYASPEQVKGAPISTASDIYSLGAVLYEMLSGKGAHQFPSAALADIERTICETEPERPSAVIGRNAAVPPGARKQLQRQLAGDLDLVVLTAMKKEPQRRYASVAELSEDLRRHMEALPIAAQTDRWSYRAEKFVRRNRLAVVAALLVATSLVGGIVATTIQARRAERRFQVARQLANAVLYDLHDRVEKLPGSLSTRVAMIQTVVRYLDNLGKDAAGDPTLDLEIAKAYSRVAALEGHPRLSSLGQNTLALEHYRRALQMFEQLAARDETREEATRRLVGLHQEIASVEEVLGNADGFAHHMRQAVVAVESAGVLKSQIPPSMLVTLYTRLGTLESARGDQAAELDNNTKAARIAENWVQTEPESNIQASDSLREAYNQLASSHAHAGNLDKARETFAKALAVAEHLRRRPGATVEREKVLIGIHHLFGDLMGAADDPNLGEPEQALVHYRAAAAIGAKLAERDPGDVNARRNLSGSYRRIGLILLDRDPAQAARFYEQAVGISTELTRLDKSNIHYRSALADGLLGLGQAMHRSRRLMEAQESLVRAIELQESIERADPKQQWLLRTTGRAHLALGNVLADLGTANDRATDHYRKALAAAEGSLQRYPSSLHHALDRVDILEAMGDHQAALAARANTPAALRSQYLREARACYQKSLDTWKDWLHRQVAVPYANRRAARMTAALARVTRLSQNDRKGAG